MRRSLIAILMMLFFFAMPLAAEWNSFIVNIDNKANGVGTQTWQIFPYDDKWTYFANKNGMLQTDGKDWNVYPLNSKQDVRSVYVSASTKRIYVGSINEFGYFYPDSDGRLLYNCMSDSLELSYQTIGNVWNIHEADNILFFLGDNSVVKYVDDKVSLIESEMKIECSNVVGGILYVGTDDGVYFLAGNTFFPLLNGEELKTKRIRSIFPYRDGVLVVTAYSGLYYYYKGELQKLETGAEEFMSRNEVFCAALDSSRIALGTIHKGIILIDLDSEYYRYFNEGTGLNNNTVLSLAFDVNGNLWAGLDNGIDYVCLNSPFSNLYSYPYFCGSGYAAVVKDGLLYIGTNRGLFYTSYPVKMGENPPDIRPMPNSSGQVWNLKQVGDDLFCLHDRGVFLVEGTSIRRITNLSGAWQCQSVIGNENLLYVGAYTGMYLLEKRGSEWIMRNKVAGLNTSCRVFEQESDRILWVDNSDRVMRMELSEDLDSLIREMEFDKDDGFPSDYRIHITKVEGKVCFATEDGIYIYDAEQGRVEPYNDLNNRLNGRVSYSFLIDDGQRIMGLNRYEVYIANYSDYRQGANLHVIPMQKFLIEQIPDYESIIPLSDSLMVLPNENGFALLSVYHETADTKLSQALYIKNMYITKGKDSLLYTANYLSIKSEPVIEYSSNSVRFDYDITSFEDSDIHLQYRLNETDWSEYTSTRTKEYTDLKEGSYTFYVRALFPDGTISQDSISFRVLPPWYRTIWAYLFYVLLLLYFAFGVYRMWDKVLEAKKRQVEVQKDKEMKELEEVYEQDKEIKEKQIMQLEKEKLEHDLEHKEQEMTNLMINVMRKNEMLTELKDDILKVASHLKGRGASESYQELILINSKIDSNIRGDELLERIEKQFDLLHNNFMTRLNEKHPNLSHNERMMCAYLIMNLSSKEIAPLLNLSVRGVETIRYRLRKKFGLDREDNLVDYLSNRL